MLLDNIDKQAENENRAISRHKELTPTHTVIGRKPKLQNRLMTDKTLHQQSRKTRERRTSRQINLQSLRIIQRLENPEIYRKYRKKI